jgi:glycosyltransferase involved in cell wall biosynthesis
MKALVIAPQPFFSPRGTPFSVYYRTLVTAEFGVEIDLLTYGEGQDVKIPGVRIHRIPQFRFFGGVKVGPSGLKAFLDVFMAIWTFSFLLRNRYDFVHAHEEAVFFCRFLKPLFGFRLLYDMHSSLPQQLSNFQFSKSKTLIAIFKRLEDSCLHSADAVISICPDLARYVENQLGGPRKHFLIENSIFETVNLDPLTADDLENGGEPVLLPQDRKLIVYAGTLESYQGIDILLSALKELISMEPAAFLLVVGGSEKQVLAYRAMAENLGLRHHCLFTGRVGQGLAKYYTAKADVLVSPRSSGTNTPLKIYEQLASGIPLVATRIYSHTQVLDDEVAILVEPEPAQMAEGLLRGLRGDGVSKAIKATELYEKHYSPVVYKEKMGKVLELLGITCAELPA